MPGDADIEVLDEIQRRVPRVPLGVDEFGQSGSVSELYELHDLLPGSIVNAALAALSLA